MEGFYISQPFTTMAKTDLELWRFSYGSTNTKRDMTRDFKDPRFDRKAVVVYKRQYPLSIWD